MYKIATMTRN